ncbi:UDP-3-O-(3-hydroxymyristoyl)glucosamine N-acyltransferase [Moraxella catarrhalis]|uniref:UDP-3-O-acylglucosamine N-acyltransferase n=4 Tax=Moraxella catarrhalis TaxID=480 RepID=A0A3A9NS86_MORCA|nr:MULTISPECIES: UDP-3-O-(3-hydroxymyristoyl)glucosamine N-acyltransferase [Moraxella]ADG60819.1 UDP-3-O-[3-hydroxymyristoyl] glucosamine N-acyltransferase LpxD [Moraxella catarrhalis BBH18]AIK01198.1 UDP-3-O-[3-hydroxymyristoyl] glucosamine N-acyltransferase [Moraxella catarrhalis]AIT42985.1 UDP-3-O-(3-hydroxymyristoyl)glucosamine N-acyltransferase [Moraxella catarrhalis]ARB67401.1 UDP-3-O-(3-hydroxymyristoyl)glucosamine N-acyltransferase [Moraxella catarrhalis]ARE66242.1 UDP-3-O-(3-hydroxymy
MPSLHEMMTAIEKYQSVLNKDDIDGSIKITGVANLSAATKHQVAFLAKAKYLDELNQTNAGVVLLSEQFINEARTINPKCLYVLVKDAYLAYACVSTLFTPSCVTGIHRTAIVADSAVIGNQVSIGANAVIGEKVVLADGVVVGAGVIIGERTQIGAGSQIDAATVIHHDCIIGEQTRIHSHANIGSEGFGFAPVATKDGRQWQRIAQLGRVIIGNHVRIGSHTCIDRGAVDDTVISDDVIIDNLVQIAHNVHIGCGTAIAANCGIAGSTKIGKNCLIGGAVGISGHLTITDDVTITSMSMVIANIQKSGSYSSGTVAMPSLKWRRAAARFRQMGEK